MADVETWARRVTAWRRSGLTAAEFCRGVDFAASTLLWYSSRLGREAEFETSPSVALVRVGQTRAREPMVVEVGDVRVHVPDGVDAATLRTVLAAIREPVS